MKIWENSDFLLFIFCYLFCDIKIMGLDSTVPNCWCIGFDLVFDLYPTFFERLLYIFLMLTFVDIVEFYDTDMIFSKKIENWNELKNCVDF